VTSPSARVVLPLVRPRPPRRHDRALHPRHDGDQRDDLPVSLSWSLVTVRIPKDHNLELGAGLRLPMLVIALVYLAVVPRAWPMRKLKAGSLGQAGSLLGG